MADLYDDLQATVIALIEEFTPDGPNAIWKSRANNNPFPNQPWLGTAGTVVEYPVRILLLPYDLKDWAYLKYRKETGVSEGYQQAYMAKQDFEPTLRDSVAVNGQEFSIFAIHDKIMPATKTLVYLIELAQ